MPERRHYAEGGEVDDPSARDDRAGSGYCRGGAALAVAVWAAERGGDGHGGDERSDEDEALHPEFGDDVEKSERLGVGDVIEKHPGDHG